jgi:hypothetical protein
MINQIENTKKAFLILSKIKLVKLLKELKIFMEKEKKLSKISFMEKMKKKFKLKHLELHVNPTLMEPKKMLIVQPVHCGTMK